MSDDLISRQAAIDELLQMVEKHKDDRFRGELLHYTGVKAMIECLPTVQPQTGRWISNNLILNRQICSECGCYFDVLEVDNYCPNCGAFMKG